MRIKAGGMAMPIAVILPSNCLFETRFDYPVNRDTPKDKNAMAGQISLLKRVGNYFHFSYGKLIFSLATPQKMAHTRAVLIDNAARFDGPSREAHAARIVRARETSPVNRARDKAMNEWLTIGQAALVLIGMVGIGCVWEYVTGK